MAAKNVTGARIGAAPLSVSGLNVIKKRADFIAASRAKRGAADGFMWQARATETDEMRIGFTCSKKVGNAVARNRAKRRLREVARIVLPIVGQPGWDYVLVGRFARTASADFTQMCTDLERILSRLHASAP